MRYRNMLLSLMIFFSMTYVEAHEGLFVKFNIGPAFYTEHSLLNESGITLPAKNHALGWGFQQKFAVQISDFGGLIKNKVGDYNYINLDALGLGFTYYLPSNTSLTVSGGQGKVTFAHDWWEITDDAEQSGYALNVSFDKEWIFAKRWGAGIGAHVFYFKTDNVEYEFSQFGFDGGVTFYFKPVR